LISLDPILKAVSKLSLGSILGLGLGYLARPFLTRIYTPEHFGLLAAFISLTAIFTSVVMLRLEDAVVLPDNEAKVKSIFKTCLVLLSCFSIALLVLLPFKDNVAGFLGEPRLSNYLVILPLAVFFLGFSRLLDSSLSKLKEFGRLSFGVTAQYSSTVTYQVLSGLNAASGSGLIFGYLLGLVTNVALLIGKAKGFFSNWGATGIRRTISEYRKFPQFAAPNALVGAFSMQIPILLLLFYFSTQSVGHYSQAYAMVAIPISVLGAAFAKVFYVEASEKVGTKSLSLLTAQTFERLLWIGLFPIMALIVIAPNLFEVVLGKDWRVSGEIARYLAPWLLLVFISSPLSKLFDVLQIQEKNLLFTIVLLIARVISLVIGGLKSDFMLAVQLFAGSSALLWFFHTAWMLNLGGTSLKRCLGNSIKVILWSIILIIPLVALSSYSFEKWISIVLALVLIIFYAAITFSKDLLEGFDEVD